jgi:hypothetical protein
MAFLCVSQQGEFKNTIKNFLGKVHVKSLWPKKLRKKKLFSCHLFPSIFFNRVFDVSLHEETKNTIKTFSKIRPENLKKSQNNVGRYVALFLFFSSSPLGAGLVGAGVGTRWKLSEDSLASRWALG